MLPVLLLLAGCNALFGPPLAPGTYSGEATCTLRAGEEGEEETFESQVTLVIDADSNIEINGEAVVVGGQVLRAIPTADLSVEVTEVERSDRLLTIRYEPRPTLPGITVDGTLVETYSSRSGSIEMTAAADLELTDVSTTAALTVECHGALTAQ